MIVSNSDIVQTYQVWTHSASGDVLVRATSYSLPEHLHDHIEVVQPTTIFSRFSSNRATYHSFRAITAASEPSSSSALASVSGGLIAASCNGTLTPECLLELYNASDYKPQVPGENKIGVTGYLEQYANYEDYHQFLEEIVPYAVDSNFSTVYINGVYIDRMVVRSTESHARCDSRWGEQPDSLCRRSRGKPGYVMMYSTYPIRFVHTTTLQTSSMHSASLTQLRARSTPPEGGRRTSPMPSRLLTTTSHTCRRVAKYALRATHLTCFPGSGSSMSWLWTTRSFHRRSRTVTQTTNRPVRPLNARWNVHSH